MTAWTAACQASLSITNSQSLLKLTSIESVMPSNHLSHPLLSPSPPAFSLSQHQSLFKWVRSLYQMAKGLELQLQHQSFQWIFRTDFLSDLWVSLNYRWGSTWIGIRSIWHQSPASKKKGSGCLREDTLGDGETRPKHTSQCGGEPIAYDLYLNRDSALQRQKTEVPSTY